MDDLRKAALKYHRLPSPGKISVTPTTNLSTQRDLALAYSPGVAYACTEIQENPDEAASLTARGNLVAVISNGTAVLGLGDIGALAGKPVMEGKGCLFKKFAGIDVFDIEVDEKDPKKLVDIIASLEPTFGGINLEDIKAPECFEVEEELKKRMKIPVFHDDQHGTAIVAAATVINGLKIIQKDIADVKLVASGAGAASIACLNLLISLGMPRANITVTDRHGVIRKGRKEDMEPIRAAFAQDTEARTLGEAIDGADIFMGLSSGGILKPEMVEKMADQPIILAMANPTPEIMPELAREIRPKALIGTGRSDYPNQVNNVLCFPFIFRGALDVGATGINEDMKKAAVHAIADLAQEEVPPEVASAYGGSIFRFGPDYLIPKPFDPRLIERVSMAVAKAAMESGVATRPIEDWDEYQRRLRRFVYRSGNSMEPIIAAAKAQPKRLVLAEGESDRVLQAAQLLVDEKMATPIVVGRTKVIEERIEALGLRIRPGEHIEVVDPENNPFYDNMWQTYYSLGARKGLTQPLAQEHVRGEPTLIASLLLREGHADAMLCGTTGRFRRHLKIVDQIIGRKPGVKTLAGMQMLMLPQGELFFCDTHVNDDPTPEQIADMTLQAAEEVRRFGKEPSVALLSHSNFGSAQSKDAEKMQAALAILRERAPDLEVDGEMHADIALQPHLREDYFPGSRLKNRANLLIMPSASAANIAYNLVRVTAGNDITVGAMLLGAAKPVHVLTYSSTVRRIANMAALAVVEASAKDTIGGESLQ